MIRRPPRSTLSSSSAASDVYKRQNLSSWDSFVATLMAEEMWEPLKKRMRLYLDGANSAASSGAAASSGGSEESSDEDDAPAPSRTDMRQEENIFAAARVAHGPPAQMWVKQDLRGLGCVAGRTYAGVSRLRRGMATGSVHAPKSPIREFCIDDRPNQFHPQGDKNLLRGRQ